MTDFEQHCVVCKKNCEVVREHKGTLMSAHVVICMVCWNKLSRAVRDIRLNVNRIDFWQGAQ